MQEFFSMGGYAVYVWPSYGLTAIVMLGLLVASVRSLKSTEATFARLQRALAAQSASEDQQTESLHGDEA